MGEKHPIEGIMYTAMQGLKDMIDVNTIVGEAVTTPDGSVIIPISKVAVGFGVGGSEFENAKNLKASATEAPDNMFGGGTGGGISLSPVAFLVVGGGQIRLIPVTAENNAVDRLIDMIPSAIDKISELFKNKAAESEKVTVDIEYDDDEENEDETKENEYVNINDKEI